MAIALILLYAAVQIGLLAWAHRRRTVGKIGWVTVAALISSAAAWMFFVVDSAGVLVAWPLKNAVVLLNLVPLFLAGAVAVVIAAVDSRGIRRTVIYALLLLSLDFYFWGGAIYTPFASRDEWDRECCLQTSEYSCGAAAAATLLKLNGIEATEASMMKPCLTSVRGTSFWGLYHGLREKADAAGKRAVASNASFDEFLAKNKPAIVFVMLDAEMDKKDARYSRDWGWRVNSAHAVVFLGMARDGRIRVADPRIGIERWNVEGMRALWRRRAVYIE